jgi:CheY-like chemotaxis protein
MPDHASVPAVSHRTVLVVDDDDQVREITRLALEVLGGWTVVEASGGSEAVRLARAHQPTVVLLDVMMPDMDGPATFAAMQADPSTRHVPVILLTAKVQVGQRQLWDGLAIAGVIAKPFSPATLSDEVDRLLEVRAKASDLPEVPRSA